MPIRKATSVQTETSMATPLSAGRFHRRMNRAQGMPMIGTMTSSAIRLSFFAEMVRSVRR